MEIKSSKTKLFLIELIVVIFFFAVSSVVCVNLFARARLMSISSSETTNAMLRAQSAAEMIRGTRGDPRSASMFGSAAAADGSYTVYYDRSWTQVQDQGQCAYQMNVTFTGERLVKASITVQKGGAELFRINTARYLESEANG